MLKVYRRIVDSTLEKERVKKKNSQKVFLWSFKGKLTRKILRELQKSLCKSMDAVPHGR